MTAKKTAAASESQPKADQPMAGAKTHGGKTKKTINFLLLTILLGTGFFKAAFAFAATQAQPTQMKYTLLESFPGFYAAKQSMNDLPGLILALYKFGIWTVGIAGLFMMVIGGIMYMTSAGNNSAASSAKEVITDSLLGIVAALGAYLFLFIINPDLTKIDLSNFVAVVVQEPTATQAEYVPIVGQLSDAEAKRQLAAANIGVQNNVCAKVTDSGCTTLEGIPRKAINGLIAMKKACSNCSFYVTGGTEGGHASHGPGNPILDVKYTPDVRNFLASVKASRAYAQYGISQVCTSAADLSAVSYGRSYSNTCKDPATAVHFHLNFGL